MTTLLWWSVQPFTLVAALFCSTLVAWVIWWRGHGLTIGAILIWVWLVFFLGLFFMATDERFLDGLGYLAYHAKNIYTPTEFHQALLGRWRNILLPVYGTWLPIWAIGLACLLGLDLFRERPQANQPR